VVKGVELDFATWSRRLHLMAKENGDWKIWRRFAIYEKARVDAVDPTVDPEQYFDQQAMSGFPKQVRIHLWQLAVNGSAPTKNLCIRGTEQEKEVREKARQWIEGA
jgi:hypothetical protein